MVYVRLALRCSHLTDSLALTQLNCPPFARCSMLLMEDVASVRWDMSSTEATAKEKILFLSLNRAIALSD